ncbi:MAG: hypothetical protein KC613_04630 [Myxococcales bacterium]|nr:hypothetical protein [Myxococcales bacterium]
MCLFLFALPVPEGGWALFGDGLRDGPAALADDGLLTASGRSLQTDPGEVRATRAFIEAWRAAVTPDQLYRWTSDPSRLARRLAHAALRRHPVPPSPGQLERLLGQLRDPGVGAEDRHDALRTLARVGGQQGADRLAQAMPTLPDDAWRLRAVTVLARSPSATTRQALLACARSGNDLLQRRCLGALEPTGSRRAP